MLYNKNRENNDQNLIEAISCIFNGEFDSSKFFPLLAMISDDPDLQIPGNLIFAVYNLLIKDEHVMAFKGLSLIGNKFGNSLGNVAGLVVRSGYLAYTKKYKQSLESLRIGYQICSQNGVNREWSGFYGEVVTRMIEIHDFGAFKREYLMLIDQILSQHRQNIENSQILKALLKQQEVVKEKTCLVPRRGHFGQFADKNDTYLNTNSGRKSKLKLNLKQSFSKDKSVSSSKRSIYSPSMKNGRKEVSKKNYVNPYGLVYKEEKVNECVFM